MVQVTRPDPMERSILHHIQPLHSRVADRLAADEIEHRILRTYVQLAVTPERADGSRCATLTRSDPLEVRLTECAQPAGTPPAGPPFWLEIYSHVTGSTVGCCGLFEFDEAELATATDLICEVCACLGSESASSTENQWDGARWTLDERADSLGTPHAHDRESGSFGRPRRLVHERDGRGLDAGQRLTTRQHAPSSGPLPLNLVV